MDLVSTNVEFTFLLVVEFSFVLLVCHPIPLVCRDMTLDKAPFLELAVVLTWAFYL